MEIKNNFKFSLTLDYEVMGDGSGDVYDLIINPTEKFLQVCKEQNISATIFFEVVEYWKIKEYYSKGKLKEYSTDPTIDMENQMRKSIADGHDVQLHIHPQWLDAEYFNGKWLINDNMHRLPDLEKFKDTNRYSMTKLIHEGKKTLENLFKDINVNYECNIFRSGGLNIYPSQDVLCALRENNFHADSSIFPYAFSDTNFTKYDYRKVSNRDIYWVTNSETLSDPTKISGDYTPFLELPIFSILTKRYQKYDIFRIYNKIFNSNASTTTISQAKDKLKEKKISEKINYFFDEESLMWDFCLFSKRKHKRYLSFIKQNCDYSVNDIHPIILIGHSKEINNYNIANLKWFIEVVKTSGFEFLSMSDITRMILNKN